MDWPTRWTRESGWRPSGPLLTWVRTGLALAGFGFVVARFGVLLHEVAAPGHAPPRPASTLPHWISGGLVVLGVLVNVAAAVHHVRRSQQFGRCDPHRPAVQSLGVVATLVLAAAGWR